MKKKIKKLCLMIFVSIFFIQSLIPAKAIQIYHAGAFGPVTRGATYRVVIQFTCPTTYTLANDPLLKVNTMYLSDISYEYMVTGTNRIYTVAGTYYCTQDSNSVQADLVLPANLNAVSGVSIVSTSITGIPNGSGLNDRFTEIKNVLTEISSKLTTLINKTITVNLDQTVFNNIKTEVTAIKGYVDNVETYLISIRDRLPAATWFNSVLDKFDILHGDLLDVINELEILNFQSTLNNFLTGVNNMLTAITNLNTTIGNLEQLLNQLTNLNISIDTDTINFNLQPVVDKLDEIKNISVQGSTTVLSSYDTKKDYAFTGSNGTTIQYIQNENTKGLYTLKYQISSGATSLLINFMAGPHNSYCRYIFLDENDILLNGGNIASRDIYSFVGVTVNVPSNAKYIVITSWGIPGVSTVRSDRNFYDNVIYQVTQLKLYMYSLVTNLPRLFISMDKIVEALDNINLTQNNIFNEPDEGTNIWDVLKSLVEKLGDIAIALTDLVGNIIDGLIDMLKSLILPSDGFFDDKIAGIKSEMSNSVSAVNQIQQVNDYFINYFTGGSINTGDIDLNNLNGEEDNEQSQRMAKHYARSISQPIINFPGISIMGQQFIAPFTYNLAENEIMIMIIPYVHIALEFYFFMLFIQHLYDHIRMLLGIYYEEDKPMEGV